ncbi:MAG: response regulator [Rhodospirillales bacterium CG15_BIG_FIL_POST_REV_8_21_14_020_66_15]|nr:MAG: response regulator [Rhodospirillales bacterium CG15_BIG_FIL_POST_REV_8_21_14_020_66_15]
MARILVVDDDTDHRAYVVQLLERLGHAATPAENGRSCLNILREKEVDAIITDIFMPGADGIELVTELNRLGLRVPVLGMTGGYKGVIRPYENLFEVLAKAKVLHKPFSARDLESALVEILADAA